MLVRVVLLLESAELELVDVDVELMALVKLELDTVALLPV